MMERAVILLSLAVSALSIVAGVLSLLVRYQLIQLKRREKELRHELGLQKYRYDKLADGVREHAAGLGNARCWENDQKLYRVAGLRFRPGDPQLPPIEEHRRECDRYRAQLYGTPVDEEPWHRLSLMDCDEGDPD